MALRVKYQPMLAMPCVAAYSTIILLSMPATAAMEISIMVKGRHFGTMMSDSLSPLEWTRSVSSSVNLKGMAISRRRCTAQLPPQT